MAKNRHAVALGKAGGRASIAKGNGWKAMHAKRTPEERQAYARKASDAARVARARRTAHTAAPSSPAFHTPALNAHQQSAHATHLTPAPCPMGGRHEPSTYCPNCGTVPQ